uniref:Uncharacterized protein n=1 Tax=Poecilia formosa TaxID=48698 RepID=A0A087YQ74_POEFO
AEKVYRQFPHRVRLRGVVPHVDVGVMKGFLHRDAAFRINDQHFGEQIPSLNSCLGETGQAL